MKINQNTTKKEEVLEDVNEESKARQTIWSDKHESYLGDGVYLDLDLE